MGRRLPAPITRLPDEDDADFAAREAVSKRRLQIMKRVYQQYYRWESLRETGEMGDILTIDGMDIYFGDLLVGLDTLPRRQRQAFELICLNGYTENAATQVILPDSLWSTTVQQYSDDGLKKMVAAYQAKQEGTWNPAALRVRQSKRRNGEVTAETKTRKPRQYNWEDTNDDHKSLAEFVNEKTGLGVTAPMVKAVSYLRKEWHTSPEQTAIRTERKQSRASLKEKYSYETKDQRKSRLAAARALERHNKALANAANLLAEIKQLRTAAGLDPETGEPLQ